MSDLPAGAEPNRGEERAEQIESSEADAPVLPSCPASDFLKHANRMQGFCCASRRVCWYEQRLANGVATLTVRDDGQGFRMVRRRPAATAGDGLGLDTVRERAKELGGTFRL
jgi:hypothetical protein